MNANSNIEQSKKYKMVHLDLKAQMPQVDYLCRTIKMLKNLGANSLLIEYEDKFPYRTHPEIVHPNAFKKEELKKFIKYAESLGIECIPLIQSLGHAEYILRHKEYSHLREVPENNWQFCPLNEEVFSLLMDMWTEIMEIHKNSSYVHLGADETPYLCQCEKCKKILPEDSYASWINRLNDEVKKRWDKNTMIWGDMMIEWSPPLSYTRIADLLSRDIVIGYWDFWNSRVFPYLDYYKEKGFKIIATSGISSPAFPNYQTQIPNITGFVKKAGEYSNVIGHLITYWAWRQVPFELGMFGFGVGLKMMQDSERKLEEIEEDVVRDIYGVKDKRLVDVFYLLSGQVTEINALSRYYACQKAQEMLARYNQSDNTAFRCLCLAAEFRSYEAKKWIVLLNLKKGIDIDEKGFSLSEIIKENQNLQEQIKEVYKNILKENESENIIDVYLAEDIKLFLKIEKKPLCIKKLRNIYWTGIKKMTTTGEKTAEEIIAEIKREITKI